LSPFAPHQRPDRHDGFHLDRLIGFRSSLNRALSPSRFRMMMRSSGIVCDITLSPLPALDLPLSVPSRHHATGADAAK
jgi:hypothetical protein